MSNVDLGLILQTWQDTPETERREFERRHGLAGSWIFDHLDQVELDRASAAFAVGLLSQPQLRLLGCIAECNPSLASAVEALLVAARAAGVDIAPYETARAEFASAPSATPVEVKGRARIFTLDAANPPTIFMPREIVRGFVREHVTLLVGAPSSGKSVFATSLVLAVATGEMCLLDAGKPDHLGDVLVVIGEDVRSTFEARIRAALKRAGLPWSFKHAIRFYGGDGRGVGLYGRERPDGPLTVLPDGRELLEEVRRNPPALIALDTAASLFPNIMENDAGDATAVMAFASSLAVASGACVTLIHHTGKSSGTGVATQDATRGSRAWTGSARTVVGIEPVSGDEAKRYPPGAIVAKVVKTNHGPEGPIGHYRKVGVQLVAVDERDPSANPTLSVVALEPAKAIAPADPLIWVDAAAVIAALRGGLSGDPNAFFGATRAAKTASARAMLAARFKLDGDAADAILKRLEEVGAIRVENRAPPGRGADRARPSVIVADDAEARVASVQPRGVALSSDPSVFD